MKITIDIAEIVDGMIEDGIKVSDIQKGNNDGWSDALLNNLEELEEAVYAEFSKRNPKVKSALQKARVSKKEKIRRLEFKHHMKVALINIIGKNDCPSLKKELASIEKKLQKLRGEYERV